MMVPILLRKVCKIYNNKNGGFFLLFVICAVQCGLVMCIPLVVLLCSKSWTFYPPRSLILPPTAKKYYIANGPELQEKHCAAPFCRSHHLQNLRSAWNGLFMGKREGGRWGFLKIHFCERKKLKACFDGKTRRQHWFWFCSIDGMWPWESKKYQTVKTYQTSQISQEMEYHFTL